MRWRKGLRNEDREKGELGRGDQAMESLGTETRRELLGTGARGELLGTGVMRGRYYYIKC